MTSSFHILLYFASIIVTTVAATDDTLRSFPHSILNRYQQGRSLNDDNICANEIYRHCGEDLDELLFNLEEANIIEIFYSISDITDCLIERSNPISMKCLIGTESEINAEDSNFIFSFQSTKTDISVTGSEACIDSIYRYCEKQMTLIDDIVENDISPKNFINGAKNLIECLMNNQNVIGTTCDDMNYIVRADPLLSNEISSPCELELFNNCGDILVDLEIAIETDDVLEISQFSLAIASCINERMSFMQSACSNKNNDNNNDLIRDDIANEVTQGSIIDEATTNTIDMTPEEALCHKVLYETCGTSLSVLEHGLKQNNPNRIAEAAIEVTGCITKSFTGLSKTCSRFQRYFGFGDSKKFPLDLKMIRHF